MFEQPVAPLPGPHLDKSSSLQLADDFGPGHNCAMLEPSVRLCQRAPNSASPAKTKLPLTLWTASGLDLTHNSVWLEPMVSGLRGYFMPEDDRSTIYIFEVDTERP